MAKKEMKSVNNATETIQQVISTAKETETTKMVVINGHECAEKSAEYYVRKAAAEGKAYGVNADVSEERKAAHVKACIAIVEWADKNPDIPFYLVLQFAVAQGAPKTDVIARGYAKRVKGTDTIIPNVNISRARQCAKWYRAYNKSGIGGASKDVVARTILKFYAAQVNPETGNVNAIKADAAFYNALKKAESLPKHVGTGHGPFKTLCENLGLKNAPKTETKTAETEAA